MADQKKIDGLKEELKMIRKEMSNYYNYFKADGVIDKDELIQLKTLNMMIKMVMQKIQEAESGTSDTADQQNDANGTDNNNAQDSGDNSTKVKWQGKVTASRLNVRKGPGTNNDRVVKFNLSVVNLNTKGTSL